jgi:hypothetical protein
MIWTGRVISGLVVLFMLMDAAMKLFRLPAVVEGSAQLGYPANTIVPIGTVLLACVVLYAVPRTAFLGALLLTGYLGGAVASNVRVGNPLVSYTLGPVYFGILVWAGLVLRDVRLRRILADPM